MSINKLEDLRERRAKIDAGGGAKRIENSMRKVSFLHAKELLYFLTKVHSLN